MLDRRSTLRLCTAIFAAPGAALAASPREVMWDDLIPPGVPYSEIVGEGEVDVVNDLWSPIYDTNATRLNKELDGAYIRMPGYMIPLNIGEAGVTEFILVPYVGACIHVPPPPANQLVIASTQTPWPGQDLWEAVWVTGTMRIDLQSTDLGQTGYTLVVDKMEEFDW